MRKLVLEDLPAPPEGLLGWPWTEASPPVELVDPPKVCVVIPSYNQAEWLECSLRSILLQGYPALECYVMDGASTDGSVRIIEKYAPWLDYWQSMPDGGQCAAINAVLMKSDAVLGTWMNADDYFAPGGIANLVELREREPENILWCGAAREIDIEDRPVRIYEPRLGTTEQLARWYSEFGFHQPAAIFDVRSFQQLGGLDESLKCCLDVELWLRMSQVGSFTSCRDLVATVRNNPRSKTFTMMDLQVVEMIAVYHRMGLEDAARWRLERYADFVEADTVNNIVDKSIPYRVLAQYRCGSLLHDLWRRLLVRMGVNRDMALEKGAASSTTFYRPNGSLVPREVD